MDPTVVAPAARASAMKRRSPSRRTRGGGRFPGSRSPRARWVTDAPALPNSPIARVGKSFARPTCIFLDPALVAEEAHQPDGDREHQAEHRPEPRARPGAREVDVHPEDPG